MEKILFINKIQKVDKNTNKVGYSY